MWHWNFGFLKRKCILRYLLILIFSFSAFSLDFEKELSKDSSVEDLNRLSPFFDIVVIQRRFLPKTGRFEISPSIVLFLSSELFINTGLGGHFSFYFLEKHGVEIFGYYSTVFKRNLTVNLENNLNIFGDIGGFRTEFIIALTYKWMPVYGKISLFNRKIIPFDVVLSVGGGIVQSICAEDAQLSAKGLGGFEWGLCRKVLKGNQTVRKKWEPALVFGIGQSFAFSKNTGLGLNVHWITYKAYLDEKKQYLAQTRQRKQKNDYHLDISLSVSWRVYFPRAKLR